MPGNYDNKENLHKMQQDALRRVREMQSRAKRSLENSNKENIGSYSNSHSQKHATATIVKTELPNESHQEKPASKIKRKRKLKRKKNSSDFLKTLFEDQERNIILILLLILAEDQADTGILLALIYLLI